MISRDTVAPVAAARVALLAACAVSLSGCLAGPSSALGGGPIGVAPDVRAADILPEPDSTNGTGFVLLSNRRDFLDATRLQLSGAGRSFERLFGERPAVADVRLTSTQSELTVSLKVAGRQHAPLVIPIEAGSRGRTAEPVRVSFAITRAVADLWLADLANYLGKGNDTSWVANRRVPLWLRTALLEGVAAASVHDIWLMQLGRTRETLPTVAALFAGEGCDSACRLAIETLAVPSIDRDPRQEMRGSRGTLEARSRYRAATASLALFFSRREGPAFMRGLMAAPLTGKSAEEALAPATSFSGADDANRQWRVWLATFIDGPGR